MGEKLSILLNIYAKGQGQGKGFKAKEEKRTLPQGMIMTYNRKKLIISFEDLTRMGSKRYFSGWSNSICPIGRIEEPFWQDFKQLQREVSQKMDILAQFSKVVQDVLFYNILDMLENREALYCLMAMLGLKTSEFGWPCWHNPK